MPYISKKHKDKIKRGPKETEFFIKVYLLMKQKNIKFKFLTDSMKERGYKKFNRQFFTNYFYLNLHFIPFTTLCHIIDILNASFTEVESINIPEEIKRKYIK